MDTILEDFEFLDLSDASDLERDRIKGILVRPVADHFQTPWNPPPPAPPSQQQQPLPPPQPAAQPPPATAYHGGVQLNGGGGGGGSTPYQAPPPTMMAPPPAAAPAPAPRPVVQLNPQAGVFVNTQPFPPAPYYPQSGPPGEAVVVGRQGPRPGGGKKRDVTASAMPPPPPHVIWNQPAAHHYYPGAAPLIVGQFSPVHPGPPAPAYVAPEQELKEQVPYSPYNPHPPHHQQHHHLPHHHHQPHYPQEQHHHHQHHHHQQQRHPIQMAPAPVTITAPPPVPAPPITVPPPVPAPVPVVAPVPVAVPPQVAAPVPVAVPPQVAAPVPVAAPVTVTAPPPTAVGVPVLPPSTAVQIVPLKFNSGNQLINGPKQMIRGDRQLVKPAGGPATAVETKARVKSVATVTVKEEKPQPVNSNPPAAAVVKVENEEKKVVVTSSNDEQPKVKQEEPAAAKSNDVTSQPTAATVKPAEVQPSPQPPVNAAPQVTAPPPPAVTVPPPTVTAPVAPAAPSYASLFSNSSSSPASRGAAAPPSRRYSGAAPAPVQVNHVASGGEQFDRGASPRTSATASKEGQHQQQQQKTSVMSPPQQKVNSVPPPLNAVTSSSASSVNNVSPLAGDPGLLRLAEYLSTYKLDHRATLLRPRGLTNRSNYCYINATLQALLACPPLYNLLKRLPIPPRKSHSASKSKTPIIDSMVQFVNEFEEIANAPSLIKSRREKHQAARDDKQQTETVPTGPAFEPSYMYRMMNNVIRNESAFPVEGRQEDAEEFLSCLLNGLNDEMVELLRLTEDSSVSNGEVIATNGDNSMDQDSDNEWKEISKKKPTITRRTKLVSTPLSQIFQGQWRSRVVRQGASETDNIQPFFTFPLDIEKAPSVKEALDNITAKNMLEGFTCPKTNRTIEAYQQLYLEELPLVLLLHLKCFDYRLQTCSKIIKNVEFTIELKIDAKLMAGSGKKATNNNNTNNTRSASSIKEREYKLFAVVYHDGKEATKGHYVADVYHVGYSTWLRYDDANVRVVPQSQVLMPRPPRVPYLLYYRRKDTIAPQPNANAKPQKTATNES